MAGEPTKPMDEVIRDDSRYPPEAYAFLHDGLSRAVKEVHGDEPPDSGQSHVAGGQICQALRGLAIDRWGMLAKTVLNRWNIHTTMDFGNMVYLLIEHGFMRKTDEDSLEDFDSVYDFDSAFQVDASFELRE